MLGAHVELGLDKIMQARGITAAKAKVCLTDKAAFNQILAMTDEAVGPLGITGTPTFLVNGKIVDAHDLASLKPFLTP
jgi:protein-disulfide isomerase